MEVEAHKIKLLVQKIILGGIYLRLFWFDKGLQGQPSLFGDNRGQRHLNLTCCFVRRDGLPFILKIFRDGNSGIWCLTSVLSLSLFGEREGEGGGGEPSSSGLGLLPPLCQKIQCSLLHCLDVHHMAVLLSNSQNGSLALIRMVWLSPVNFLHCLSWTCPGNHILLSK